MRKWNERTNALIPSFWITPFSAINVSVNTCVFDLFAWEFYLDDVHPLSLKHTNKFHKTEERKRLNWDKTALNKE